MNMHELQHAWRSIEVRLDAQESRSRQAEERRARDRTKTWLKWTAVPQTVQLIVGGLLVLWAGGYWFDHRDQAHLMASGMALHLYGLGLLVAAILQLTRLACLTHDHPALETQHQIQALGQLRKRSERLLLLAGFAAWTPASVIVLHAWGWDLWQISSASVGWTLAVSTALGVVAVHLTYRYRDAFDRKLAVASTPH